MVKINKPRSLARFWYSLLLAIVVVHSLAPQGAEQGAPRRILLWKISSPTSVMFLLGSIHVGKRSMYPLPREIESAFARSGILVVEVNPPKVSASETLAFIRKYGTYRAGDSLSRHVPKKTMLALREFCSRHGLDSASIERMKPWMAAVTILAVSLKSGGEDPTMGIDMHFLTERTSQQRIEQLETPYSQLSVFAFATEQEQQEMLDESLKHSETAAGLTERIQDAYLHADMDRLTKSLHEQEIGPPSLVKKLIDNRNLQMAKRLEQHLRSGDRCFVVIGLAHLVGPNGVTALLHSRGYQVEQLVMPMD